MSILFLCVLGFSACEKLDSLDDQKMPDIAYSPSYPVCGEWWIRVQDEKGVYLRKSYSKILTFGTASNTADSIWLTDTHTGSSYLPFWEFKVKTKLEISSRSFFTTAAVKSTNTDGLTVLVEDGKVIVGGGKSTSGVVCDSIAFKVSFSDDDPSFGHKYLVSGVRRTGFLEDEH